MNENEKNATLGEPISEEQLDAVSGGFGTGDVSDPYHSHLCWFRAEGEPRENGRIRCMSECKGLFDVYGNPIFLLAIKNSDRWYICDCWGTDFCIDKWHKPCDKSVRTAW